MSESLGSRFETPTEKLVIIGVISLFLSLGLALGTDAHPLAFLVYWGPFYMLGHLVGTETGRKSFKKHWKEAREQNNQQQMRVGSNSEPTKICSECGWKNPKGNNYCNDCGFSFDSGEGNE